MAALFIGAALLLLSSCNRDVDEFKFKGYVVGGGACSASQVYYVIDILSPDSLGDDFTFGGFQYHHAVTAYKASRQLYQGDTIYGVAYFTKSYAELNCIGISDTKLPEIILLSTDEEAF